MSWSGIDAIFNLKVIPSLFLNSHDLKLEKFIINQDLSLWFALKVVIKIAYSLTFLLHAFRQSGIIVQPFLQLFSLIIYNSKMNMGWLVTNANLVGQSIDLERFFGALSYHVCFLNVQTREVAPTYKNHLKIYLITIINAVLIIK